MPNPALDLADAIWLNLANLKAGSLCFWDQWFGKPHDNSHRVVGAQPIDDAIVIYFDNAETLSVEAPRDWSLEDGVLIIRTASRVRFQWFYCGQFPSRETLHGYEYVMRDGRAWSVDADGEMALPETDAPAVQLHG